jgi:serine protease AprX
MPVLRLPRRPRTTVAVAMALALLVPCAASTRAAPTQASGSAQRVIVQAVTAEAARDAVEAVGGRVSIDLPIINGVAAEVPAQAMSSLALRSGVRAVSPDAAMTIQSSGDERGLQPNRKPRSVYPEVVRSDKLGDRGGTGAGVTVAVLDTGINETADLAGRILPISRLFGTDPCVNLSGEPTCDDDYGHGTFMAGIIAGDGTASNGRYVGAAPEADLVSIKIASADGSADVSNVLAGIQWAVSFKDDYDIRVLNLSLGTNSLQSWLIDPLNYAVEKAWKAGITVVVAASNRGPDAGTISKPGDDPYVITVGATDDVETVRLTDDVLPDFSSRGPAPDGVAKPDVVAPGGHIVSLRALGSTIDTKFTDYIDGTYRRGSGTSMSTAVVSGVAAAILSRKPTIQPDRLKFMLMDTAKPVAVPDKDAVGQGMVDAYAAAFKAGPGLANRGLLDSNGAGQLNLSRGDVHVTIDGLVLSGAWTAQLLIWDVIGFLGLWNDTTWFVSQLIFPWYLTQWYGETWMGHNWEGCSWGDDGEGDCFYGHNWEGSAWYGAWD